MHKLRRRMYQSLVIFWLSVVIIFMQSPTCEQVFKSSLMFKCGQFIYMIIFKILTNCQYTMSAEPEKSILIRAYECKARSKFNLQEFFEIVNTDSRLTKLSEKGLLILYLCQMLLKAYIASGLKIRNFISQFDKKAVKKRQKRQGGDGERRKRNKKREAQRENKTLEQLSNESLSNPSNIERPRINVQNRIEDSSNPALQSKDKGEDSNGSRENGEKDNLRIQLNKITEQIRGHEETYVPDVDFLPNTQFQQNSQSSSQYSGQISNLSEKVKIFTSDKQSQQRTTATRKKTGNKGLSRQTRTKKKKFQFFFDESTFIQETRATQNSRDLNYTEISHFDTQQAQDFDLTNNFNQNLKNDLKQIVNQIFQKQKLELFRNLIHDQRQRRPIDIDHQFSANMMPTDENQIGFPDYTMSQPTSAPTFQPDFVKQSLQLKDSQFGFRDLVNHSTKDQATLFYQLLWREQNDQIRIYQSSPEIFSEIRVKQK